MKAITSSVLVKILLQDVRVSPQFFQILNDFLYLCSCRCPVMNWDLFQKKWWFRTVWLRYENQFLENIF